MASGILLKPADAGDIGTPATGKVTVFLDQATGEPAFKDDTGTVTPLRGAAGATGATGDAGDDGDDGQGVPTGGTTGQRLAKIDGTDFNTEWVDSSEGIPAGGTTGQILKKQSGSDFDADWENEASGSAPAWVTNHPDTPPGSPNADDHEYQTGDTIGGTTLGSPGVAPAIANQRLVITGNAPGVSSSVVAVVYSAPTKPYTVTAKVRNATTPNTYGVVGILLRSSASGRFRTVNITRTGADFHTFTCSSGAYTDLVTRASDDSSTAWAQPWAYVRLTYSGSTISVYVSEDGTPDNWHLLRSDTDSTHFTGGDLPDQFGVFVDSFAGTSRVGFIEWLRVT